MRYIPKEELKRAAKAYHQKYALLPEFQGETISRIEPQVMAERVLGLKLAQHRLSLDFSILGFSTNAENVCLRIFDHSDEVIFIMTNPRTIVVDCGLKDVNIGRFNFTIMHEVAHHIINEYFYGGKDNSPHYYRFSKSGGNPEEYLADMLASYLLMPKALIDRGMSLFDIDARMLIGYKLPQTRERFAQLAEYLGVSKEALRIRMTELGYVRSIIVEPPDAEGA